MADTIERAIYNNLVGSQGLSYVVLPSGAIATVVTAAAAWVYGAYGQIAASTAADYQVAGLTIEAGTITVGEQGELALATGGAGNEVDFAVLPISAGTVWLPKPVKVAAATRLAARLRTSSGNADTVGVKLILIAGF